MTTRGEELWEVYAPDASPWSAWAKPVLFAQMSSPRLPSEGARLASVDVSWAPEAGRGSAVVVDLDGPVSVAAGIALANRGYRPVPLFNGIHGTDAVIDVAPIQVALELGAGVLREVALPPDAPPAFLLDARRRRRRPDRGHFDNRWVVFPQDLPSGTWLRSRRLDDAIVWTEAGVRPKDDLEHVLRGWQDAGVRIRQYDFGKEATPYPVPKPSHFRAAWYRMLALVGLGRAAVGGFGTRIPLLPESRPGSGGRIGFYG